jgi:hypothetical protein
LLQNTPTFKQTGHQAAKYSIYTTYNQTLTKTKTKNKSTESKSAIKQTRSISLICSTIKQRNLHIHLLINTPALKKCWTSSCKNSKHNLLYTPTLTKTETNLQYSKPEISLIFSTTNQRNRSNYTTYTNQPKQYKYSIIFFF